MALAEDGDLLAAVRALDVAHVLHQTDDGDVQHIHHLDGFFHDHAHQLLRRGNQHRSVHRDGLAHGQHHVAGSRRHIDEQHVLIAPDHVRPELGHSAGDDRAAPGYGVAVVGQKQVQAHHVDAGGGAHGENARVVALGLLLQAEFPGNGRAGDVRVQNAHLQAHALHGHGQQRRDHGFAHAALAAAYADDLFDVALLMGLLQQAFRLGALAAALPAGGAVMCTFAHDLFPSVSDCRKSPRSAGFFAENRFTPPPLPPARPARPPSAPPPGSGCPAAAGPPRPRTGRSAPAAPAPSGLRSG